MRVGHGFGATCAILLAVFLVLATNAMAYDISGSVTNATGKSGRIYLNVQQSGGWSTGLGVSIPAAGPYTIRGLANGSYTVQAFQDTQVPEAGIHHASDPVGLSASVTVNGANVSSGADLALADPSAPILQPPSSVMVTAGDGLAFVTWEAPYSNSGVELTRYYTVYWSTTPNPGPGNFSGKSGELPSARNSGYLVGGLTNGGSYYFAVTARLASGATESVATGTATGAPVVVGPASGGFTVSGTVDTSAIAKGSGALWVAVARPEKGPLAFTYFATPADLQAYSVTGVPPGNYQLFAILDMNNNGVIDAGDYMTADRKATSVAVGTANVTGADFSLSPQPTDVSVSTNQWMVNANPAYSLNFQADGVRKLPVNVAVSGPQVPGVLDMAADEQGGGSFRSWYGVPNRPQVNPADSYSFSVAYADGTSTGATPLTAQVSAVIDATAAPVAPVGSIATATPTFTWSAPATPPSGPYAYSISLDGNGANWQSARLPASQLSAVYNFDGNGSPLWPGTPYTWKINLSDAQGNSSTSSSASFTLSSVSSAASGTYSYDAASGLLALTWAASNFVCEGPQVGPENKTVTALSATTLAWLDAGSTSNTMTWTRSGGTGTGIVGTWTTTSALGNSYTLNLNADGTVAATGTVSQCGGGTVSPTGPMAQVVNNSGAALYQVQVGGLVFMDNLASCGNGCSTGFSTVPSGSDAVQVQQGAASTPVPAGTWPFAAGNSYAVNVRNVGGYCVELWQRSDTVSSFNSDTTRVLLGTNCGTGGSGTISFSGTVKNSAGGVAGVTVQVVENPSLSATTAANGTFSIAGIPAAQNFNLKASATGIADTYLGPFNSSTDITGKTIRIYSGTEMSTWGLATGKGAITGQVMAGGTGVTLAGATVSIQSATGSYTVLYDDGTGTTPVAGTATGANGRFYILNVNDADVVTVTATATGWSFGQKTFTGHANAVSEGSLGAGTIAFTGATADTSDVAIAGVKAELVGYPGINATSATDGSFTLNGAPSGNPFSVKMSMTGYLPVFTHQMNSTSTVNSGSPYSLYAPAEATALGLVSGKGMIKARVVDSANPATGYLAGVTLTASSSLHPGSPYTVLYNDGTTWGGSATFANGKYMVLNVDDGDTVVVQGTMSGWSFNQRTFHTHADAVSESRIQGTSVSGPSITVTPKTVTFTDSTGGGSLAPQTITLTNNGTANLTVQSTTLTGDAMFTVAPGGLTPCPALPAIFTPGQGCTLVASFSPSGTGQKTASFVLNSNAVNTPALTIPLSGYAAAPAGGSISGKVSSSSSASGIPGVTVQLYDAVSSLFQSMVTTDSFGNYAFSGVQTGSYKVQFTYNAPTSQTTSSSQTIWYNNATSMAAATAVAVTAPGSTTGINAVFTVASPPQITGFAPQSGAAQSSVTITGTGFGAAGTGNAVFFNGAPATVVSWSDTQIVALVPSGASSGPLSVSAQGISAAGSTPFTVINPPPVVTFTLPARDATAMPVNGGVLVNFDRQMDNASINAQTFTLQTGAGASVPGTVLMRDDGYLFIPAAALAFNQSYTATIGTGVKSADGVALASAYSWSFTTAPALGTGFSMDGLFSLHTSQTNGVADYLYAVIRPATDASHLTETWYAYQAATKTWVLGSAPAGKDQNYALTDTGWLLGSDGPSSGTVSTNSDGSFTWTNSANGESQRMEPVQYDLAGQPLANYANPIDLPALPVGSYPAGSLAFMLRNTALTDTYRVGVWIKDPALPDQNYVRYFDSNSVEHTATVLTDLPTLFATGQNLSYLFGFGSIGMQLGQNGSVQLSQFGPQGPTPLTATGTWEYLTVKGQQLLVVHLPQALKGGMQGELFYAAVNGVVKQGEWRAVGTLDIDPSANYNQTAFDWMISAPAPLTQSIVFGTAPALSFGGGSASVSATGGASGNPVTFSSTTPSICGVSSDGSSVTPLAVGTCIIAANQAGGAGYAAAAQVTQNITVAGVAPGAPVMGGASAGNSQAMVSFIPPTATGGLPITGYTVTSNPAGGIDMNAGKTALTHTVTGLVNGTPYSFTVSATNGAGTGPASAASGSVTPATRPEPPVAVSATAGDSSAQVSFGAPNSDGGSPITGYTAIASPGGFSATGAGSPITVTGLGNGVVYSFTVTASNLKGSSAPSAPSNSVKPVTVPGAPTAVSAAGNNASATVSFTPPTYNGGSLITGYTVVSSPAGGVDGNAGSLGTLHTVTGLTNGTPYIFTVSASNAAGTGAASQPSNPVTPSAAVPGAPSGVSAVGGNAGATVSFSAPAFDGGSALTGFTVSSDPAGGVDSNAGTLVTTHTITGLTNGTSYIFRVSAVNGTGSSVPSAPSNRVTPATVPAAPSAASATVGNAHATVSFALPASDGGSAITSYTVTSSPGNFSASAAAGPIVVLGLQNGTAYSFSVTATNAVGTGPASAASNTVTPDLVPGAPSAVSAVGNNASATVSFTAAPPNGGSAVTGYTVTSTPGGFSATGTASPITVTGLSNGTPYSFTVTASNARGSSPASAPSNSATPDLVPGAPTGVAASHGNASTQVSFSAPAPNGGSAIIRYTATSSPGGISVSGAASPISITGLSNGTPYTFTVSASNAKGMGPASDPSTPMTPSADVPGAPVAVSASAGNAGATVSFAAPASNGGSPITGYVVTSYPAGGVDGNAGTLALVHGITGLNNGTSYSFTVTASNDTGAGAASLASNSVTPVTVPGAPTSVSASADHGQASVSFSAPAADGGSAITRYTVTSGGISVNGPASPITVTGLVDGTSYSFTVTATSAVGTGPASAPSNTVTPADTVAPIVRSFSVPGSLGALDTATSATLPVLALSATDNAAVTGYLVTQSSAKPAADAAGWSSSIPTGCDIDTTPGEHTLYAWAKDASGNVSTSYSATLVVTPIDTTPPVILSGPNVTSLSNTTAVLEWQTSEAAQGGVNYGTAFPLVAAVNESDFRTSHSVTLTGLTADTTYFASVFATDHSGNGPTLSKQISLRTKPAPDTTAPYVIEGPVVTGIGADSATVQWRTNESAQGQIFYGTANTLGQSVAETDFGTLHSLKLTGLSAETAYFLKVAVTDLAGNGPRESGMVSFKTVALPDTTAPVIVEGPMAVNLSDTGATILWKTDEPATSTVISFDGANYGFSSDSALGNSHSITLTGLQASTPYSYKVSSTDGSGNTKTLESFKTFTTLAAPDLTAPVIIEGPLVVEVSYQSAAIRWGTDEPADSVIEYGTSESLGASESQSGLQRTHNLTLAGLDPGTLYYFRVASTDSFGNGPSYSKVFSFSTADDPSYKVPVITVAPTVIYKTDTSMTIYWETDDPSDSVVDYGEDNQLTQRVSNSDKVNKHQITITNLKVNTSYKVVVSSTNMSGNTVFAKAGATTRMLAYNLDSVYSDAGGAVPLGAVTTAAQADVIPPVITVAPSVIGITDQQATVAWTTDEISDSQVAYGPQGGALSLSAGDPTQVASHVVVLTNLTASTQYQFRVFSTDPSGNGPTGSAVVSFTTAAAPDTTPPVFQGTPALVISFQDATGKTTIGWSTDEPASTQIRYGTSADAMTSQGAAPGLSQSHTLTLALAPGTTYYAAAIAMDSSGNVAQSATLQFTTMGTLDVTEPSTTPSLASGSYLGPQSLTLSADKPAAIYYTTDGSTPTASSAQYNGPIPVAVSKTVKYFAIDAAGNKEVPKSAQLVIQFAISASSDANGSISCPSAVDSGQTGVCTLIPNTGFRPAGASGCGGTLNGTAFTTGAIGADCSVAASFTPITFSVTPQVTGSGGMFPATAQTVNYGATTSFTITPASGYEIASVTGCGGTLTGSSYTTGVVTGACEVSASFIQAAALGDVNHDGSVDVADALRVLRISVGLITPTAWDWSHGDVGPLVNGQPTADGKIDLVDAVLILKKAIGLQW